MSKKILAGVLAAASILSMSAVASAATPTTKDIATEEYKKGTTYNVGIEVTYGEVSAEVPTTTDFGKAYLNPYNATVKTKITEGTGDAAVTTVVAKNNSYVASGVYAIKNLDEEEGLLVTATTKITKATGVVIKNPSATAPWGWAKVTGNDAGDWDYLTDYDKLTLKDSAGKGVTETKNELTDIDSEKSTGGAASAKQGKNVGMWLVGGMTETDFVDGTDVKNFKSNKYGEDEDLGYVAFDPKTETTGELMTVAKKAGSNPTVGYFTIGGEMSAATAKLIDEAKDKVTFTVVFKLTPVAPTT